jgi:hypothetical protein
MASAKDDGSGRSENRSDAWFVLGWIGIAFLTVGGADFVLSWFPVRFGSAEWGFGTVTQAFNGLPIVLLGIGLSIVAGEQVGRRWWELVGFGAACTLLVWMVVGFVIWAWHVPGALATVPEQLAGGLSKAIVKTLLQSLVYPALLIYLVRRVWPARRSQAMES